MSDSEHPPPALVVTLAALTVVSGFIDAVSFLGLGHVFTANMTGNVLLIGFAAAGAAGFSLTASLCALGAFLAGAVAGGRLALRFRPVRNLLLVAMVIEAACTAAAATVAGTMPAVSSGGMANSRASSISTISARPRATARPLSPAAWRARSAATTVASSRR